MADDRGATIPIAQAAALLMVTDQWIRDLARKGYGVKPDRGRVPLVAVVQGYIRFLKDEERRTSKTASLSKVQEARADEIALRIEEKSGALIAEARAEALGVVDEVIGGLRAALVAVPARVTPDIGLRRIIEDAIDEAFGEAAQRSADCAAGVEAGG